ncbi:TetR/AcrR family transcriptional regulator [Schleiferilactobacillus perolens]|jgi:AcrR family transcriptional regulator|uniref:TetR/AcrR family transcriptional regulator n=1 Tax=Schleiferilactobacillus perolens TaxID=100468 RepID=UPI002356562F|nr:TetR/AcrR family transcriptional regulator [Schleiferilactobacillus perolens]MCI2170445.1 TetR/AcrR family transcriptional regulator [Schleiferilactobacillus perolens]
MAETDLQLFRDTGMLQGMTTKQISIIAAAVDVFAENGYANSSTKEIAKRAGVAEGNIFSTFTNKRGLLHAIIDPVSQSLFPQAVENLVQGKLSTHYATLADFLNGIAWNRIDYLRQNSKVIKIFVAEVFYDEKLRQRFIRNFPISYWLRFDHQFSQLKKAGQLVQWPNAQIGSTMAGIIGEVFLGYLFFKQPLTDATIQRTIDTLVLVLTPK